MKKGKVPAPDSRIKSANFPPETLPDEGATVIDLSSAENRVVVAFKAIVALSGVLDLSEGDCSRLLGLPVASFRQWKKRGPGLLTSAQWKRLVMVLAIYSLAGTSFPRGEGTKGWLARPNSHPLMAGRRPLDVMLSDANGGLERVLSLLGSVEAIWS